MILALTSNKVYLMFWLSLPREVVNKIAKSWEYDRSRRALLAC